MKQFQRMGMVLLASFPFICTALGQPVFIKTEFKNGQGTLRSRGDQWYVITAAHVVEGYPAKVLLDNKDHWVNAISVFRKSDIEILRLESKLDASLSTTTWRDSKSPEIRTMLTDGSILYTAVTKKITNNESVRVKVTVTDSFERIREGMSGSMLYVENEKAGMLDSVSTDGEGNILLIKEIEKQIEEFFKELDRPSVTTPHYLSAGWFTLASARLILIPSSSDGIISAKLGWGFDLVNIRYSYFQVGVTSAFSSIDSISSDFLWCILPMGFYLPLLSELDRFEKYYVGYSVGLSLMFYPFRIQPKEERKASNDSSYSIEMWKLPRFAELELRGVLHLGPLGTFSGMLGFRLQDGPWERSTSYFNVECTPKLRQSKA